METKKVKEELREKIFGFEVTKYLLETGTIRTEKQKEDMVNDSYKRLEKWIFENVGNVKLEEEPVIDPEDTTINMDF